MYSQPSNPLIEQNRSIFKSALKTPVTLILGTMLALTGIITIAYYLSIDQDISDLVSKFASNLRHDYFPCYERSANEMFKSGTEIYLLCTVVAPFLSFVGYLLTFVGSIKKTGTPKAGTVFLIISSIASLLGFCSILVMYISSFEAYFELIKSPYHTLSSDYLSKFIRITLVMAGYLLFGISSLIFSCSLSVMCKGKKRSKGGSVFFGISSAFVAFCYLALIIDLSENAKNFSDVETLFLIALVFSCISYILSAVMAFIFRANINTTSSYVSTDHPYTATQPNNFYGSPVDQYPPIQTEAPFATAYQNTPNTDYSDNFSSNDTPTYPIYTPVADTQPLPSVPTPSTVSAPTAVREAEDGFTIDKDFVGDVPVFCSECGSPITPQQIFCAQCGKKLK